MTTSRIALALAAASAVVGFSSQAAVPSVDSVGRPAVVRCGSTSTGKAVNASHADKIIFELSGFVQSVVPADQAALNLVPRLTPLDIKVIDNPKTVADLKGKTLTFLGAIDNSSNREAVRILEVMYAMVCPTTAAP